MAMSIARIVWAPLLVMLFISSGCSTAKTDAASSTDPSQRGADARKAQSQSSLDDLKRGAAPATPKDSPLKEIYFDFDSYDLRADARKTLTADGEWLKDNPAARVDIEGHTDERGTTEYNLALGAKRAQAAKDYLVNLGVAAERLTTTSYGKEAPVCREHNEKCWAQNRRDRFVVRGAKPGV